MDKTQQEKLIAAVREGLKKTGMTQKELARKSGTSSGQLSMALGGSATMSQTKWQMACEALGLDYDEILAHQEEKQQPEEGQSLSQTEQAGTDADKKGSPTKPVVLVPAGPDRSAVVLEEVLAERDKTIAKMEAALKGAASENQKAWHENQKLREALKQVSEEGTRMKVEMDALKERQSEMIRQAEAKAREREAQNLMRLKAYFFDREHPDLPL